MKKKSILALTIILSFTLTIHPVLLTAREEITILVDGVPLDAKGIALEQNIYIPAWILENYGNTRILWKPGSSILEITTHEPDRIIDALEGTVSIRIGFYAEEAGFVIGKNIPVYFLNVAPATLSFEGIESLHERAHSSTLSRLGPINKWVMKYLNLSPPERHYKEGWQIISKMNKETILGLSKTVEKYESLYRDFYYDILSTLVIEKERKMKESVIISPDLKNIKILKMITDEEGIGKMTLPNGTHFIFCRMLYQDKIILWNLPVTVTGSDISLELTNRNITFMK